MQNFYFMWIQQNWEHDNFEKLRNFRFGKFRKESYFPWITPISFEPSRIETSSILRKWKELQNWELLVESHICLLAKITNTTISTDKHTSRINSEGNIFFCIFLMIINFRSINDEKICETWDLKNYINNYIFSPNSSYFLRIQQTFRKNVENKSFGEISDILIFYFTKCQGVIWKSEKIWKVIRKTLRI